MHDGLAAPVDGADTYLNMINNKDVGADCNPTTKDCNIQIQDFPIQLQTPCSAGDCVSDKNPVLNQGKSDLNHQPHLRTCVHLFSASTRHVLSLPQSLGILTMYGSNIRDGAHHLLASKGMT